MIFVLLIGSLLVALVGLLTIKGLTLGSFLLIWSLSLGFASGCYATLVRASRPQNGGTR